jgi:hypothetical protein
VLLLQVGTDSKAVSDAWSLVEKKHGDKVAGLFVSVDADKGRALAYAGVFWLVFVHGLACICIRCTAGAAPYL